LWLYGSWIYNYQCNQSLSPLMLWVRTPLRWGILNTTLCDKSLSVTCGRSVVFSGYAGFTINKTDCHDITEILLKVALNTKTKPNQKKNTIYFYWTKTYFSKSILPSDNLCGKFSPIKCSAILPKACSNEDRSFKEQCNLLHSFSAAMVNSLLSLVHAIYCCRLRYTWRFSLNGSYWKTYILWFYNFSFCFCFYYHINWYMAMVIVN
jgi:hypothetical protein